MDSTSLPELLSAPRMGENADRKGYYDLVARINNGVINRGQFLEVEVYISGYGNIQNPKFVFFPSLSIISEKESEIFYDLGKVEGRIKWGQSKMAASEDGIFIDLSGGIIYSKWETKKPTLFFDVRMPKGAGQIMTETSQNKKPPIKLNLKIKRKAAAGNHFLHFAFTYFNGEEWTGSTQLITFTINNIFQENEVLLQWVAIVVAVVTIASSMLSIISLL